MSAPGFTVYVITGPRGFEYVGCTGQTIEQRFRNHVTGAHLIADPRSLAHAMRLCGPEAFTIRAIAAGLQYEAACYAEQQAIWARKAARGGLYNIRPGGLGLTRSRHLKAA